MSEESELQDLAAEINKPQYEFEPCTMKKGEIVAVDTATSPPTVTITLSGSDVQIPGVLVNSSYTPVVGHTVHVFQQKSAIYVDCRLMVGDSAPEDGTTAGWVQPAMGTGWTNVASGRGFVRYRRIIDHGAPKIQWSGSVVRSSGTGTTVITGLPADCSPPETRTVLAARNAAGGSNNVVLEFQPGGTVNIVGDTTAPQAAAPSTNVTTATNQSTTATNQSTTANNQTASGTTGSTTAVNNSTTADNNNTGLTTDGTFLGTLGSTITIHNTTADNNNAFGPDDHDHSQNPHSHGNDSHSHGIGSHSHSIASHDHSQNAHNHTQDSHTHSMGSHDHTQDAHNHTQDSHNHTQNSHSHTTPAHTHDVNMTAGASTWMSFDGIEYFV